MDFQCAIDRAIDASSVDASASVPTGNPPNPEPAPPHSTWTGRIGDLVRRVPSTLLARLGVDSHVLQPIADAIYERLVRRASIDGLEDEEHQTIRRVFYGSPFDGMMTPAKASEVPTPESPQSVYFETRAYRKSSSSANEIATSNRKSSKSDEWKNTKPDEQIARLTSALRGLQEAA